MKISTKLDSCVVVGAFTATALLISNLAIAASGLAVDTYYVSPTGATSADCRSAASACTLARAQEIVRSITPKTSNIDIVLMPGEYDVTLASNGGAPGKGIQLSQSDSGGGNCGSNTSCVVRYISAQHLGLASAPSVLTGGLTLTGWTKFPGVKNIWMWTAPAGVTLDKTSPLFVNGERRDRAKIVLAPHKVRYGVLPSGVSWDLSTATYSGVAIPAPADVSATEIVFTKRWEMQRCPVVSYQAQRLTINADCANASMKNWAINTDGAGVHGLGLNWVENDVAFISQPGQFAINTHNQVFYWPRQGEQVVQQPDKFKVVVPIVEGLITVNDAVNVSFEGLTFQYAAWARYKDKNGASTGWYTPHQAGHMFAGSNSAGVTVPGGLINAAALTIRGQARNIKVDYNTFRNLGGLGVHVAGGIDDVTIYSNKFSDISASALLVGSNYDCSQKKYFNNNVQIVLSRIDATGVEFWDSPGLNLLCLSNSYIWRNAIFDIPWSGMSVGTGAQTNTNGSNSVKWNYIENAMSKMHDGGAIYTDGPGNGTVIEANRIYKLGQPGAGTPGIYLDQKPSGFTVKNNYLSGISSYQYWLQLHVEAEQYTLNRPADLGIAVNDNLVDRRSAGQAEVGSWQGKLGRTYYSDDPAAKPILDELKKGVINFERP